MTKAVVDELAGMIIGSDALNSEFIWQDLYARLRDHGQKGLLIEGLSDIDIALWDIRGKYFNVPAYQLLGGAMRTAVQAYTTGLYRRDSGDCHSVGGRRVRVYPLWFPRCAQHRRYGYYPAGYLRGWRPDGVKKDSRHGPGVRTNPHVWGSGIGIAASLQWMALIPTQTPLSLTPVQPLLGFDQTEHPIRQAILQQPIVHHHGRVAIPSGPGLGIDVDRSALAAFAVA